MHRASPFIGFAFAWLAALVVRAEPIMRLPPVDAVPVTRLPNTVIEQPASPAPQPQRDPVYVAQPTTPAGPSPSLLFVPQRMSPDAWPDGSSQLVPNDSCVAEPEKQLPPGAKDGILQRLSFQSTWLPSFGGPAALQMHDEIVSATLGFPFPTIESPLLLTPLFGIHLLEGPQETDLPPRLYDATVDIRWLKKLTPRLGMDLAVTPGVYSDFEHEHPQNFRLTGRLITAYDWSPTSKIVLGVAYVNRTNVRILPIVGILYQPNDDLKMELVFPQPRIARRFIIGPRGDWWGYVGGEFGGGVWAIERVDGTSDVATINDWRLRLGVEHKVTSGLETWYELGYVFNRTLRYESSSQIFDLADTLMVRAGVAY